MCRFFNFWPSLIDLHNWVLDSWRPLVASEIEFFLCAKGFFIASFSSYEARKLVLVKLRVWGEQSLN